VPGTSLMRKSGQRILMKSAKNVFYFSKLDTLSSEKLPNRHKVLSFLSSKGEESFRNHTGKLLHEAAYCLALL